jgi:hypothetical protein
MNPLLHELDHRNSDGTSVTLLWRPSDDRLLVSVIDRKLDESFEVEVQPGERALDVFHHPYAYAAWHGVTPLSLAA